MAGLFVLIFIQNVNVIVRSEGENKWDILTISILNIFAKIKQ